MASSFCKTIYTKFFRVKPLELMLKIQENEQTAGTGLRRELNLYDVIAYGIGSTVGAGLFVVTGKAARVFAGPAVSLSFVFSAIACLFSALCYAEFASRVPVSGSAYSFAYASVGEGIAWFIGWNLTLEYGISAAAIARGWSNYFVEFCKAVGAPPPWWLYDIPLHLPPVLVSASPLAGIIVFFLYHFIIGWCEGIIQNEHSNNHCQFIISWFYMFCWWYESGNCKLGAIYAIWS